ncbi:MAG: DUF4407 domain-containing protein [Myxococcales bacterium]|nr:DUF4407 domain-containing protein [Myxococcales bacterium]
MTAKYGAMEPEDDDELLARMMAEDESDLTDADPRLDDLAAGRASEEDVARLRAEAATDDALAERIEAMEPFDDAFVHRLASFAPAHFRKAASESAASGGSWIRWLLGGLALAAPLVIAWLIAAPGPSESLVDYQVQWRSGDQDVRSTPASQQLPTFASGSSLRFALVPATRTDAEVAVFVFVDGSGPVDGLQSQVLSSGVVKIEGTVGEGPLVLEIGRHALDVVLGPVAAGVPTGSTPGAPWQHTQLSFVVGE